MAFAIVTDSSSNLTEEVIDQFDLHILPLTFMVDGEEHHSYLKGQKTDLKQFYTMMREGKVITTSLPNLKNSRELLEGLLASGQDVLYIGFSSGLSGTYQAIDLLLAELADAYPPHGARGGHPGRLHGRRAARLVRRQDARGGCVHHRGSRLAGGQQAAPGPLVHRGRPHVPIPRRPRLRTSAWAGTLLNIKPVMHVDDEGHLIPLEKVRGRKKSLKALVDHMAQTATSPVADQTVFISHGDCIEDAEYVADLVRERFGVTDILINYVDPVIGAHSGPGTMALFFLASER